MENEFTSAVELPLQRIRAPPRKIERVCERGQTQPDNGQHRARSSQIARKMHPETHKNAQFRERQVSRNLSFKRANFTQIGHPPLFSIVSRGFGASFDAQTRPRYCEKSCSRLVIVSSFFTRGVRFSSSSLHSPWLIAETFRLTSAPSPELST